MSTCTSRRALPWLAVLVLGGRHQPYRWIEFRVRSPFPDTEVAEALGKQQPAIFRHHRMNRVLARRHDHLRLARAHCGRPPQPERIIAVGAEYDLPAVARLREAPHRTAVGWRLSPALLARAGFTPLAQFLLQMIAHTASLTIAIASAVQVRSDLTTCGCSRLRVFERFNAADFDSCFTPAAGCDGRRRENDVSSFISPQEVVPLLGRQHPGQMPVGPGKGGLAEAKVLETRVVGRNELHLEINHRDLIKHVGRKTSRVAVWSSFSASHRQ